MRALNIPQEQVNDQTVLLVDWLAADGAEVSKGQPIASIETSKTTFDFESPDAGILRYRIAKGSEVAVGAVFCYLAANRDEPFPETTSPAPTAPTATTSVAAPSSSAPADKNIQFTAHAAPTATSTRFSPRALELIKQHGLNIEQFQGRGLVRERDVLAMTSSKPTPTTPTPTPAVAASAPAPIPASGVPVRTENLSRMKRVEAKYLASGHHNTLTSVVSVICLTSGLKAAASLHPEMGGSTSAIIVYETARLLRKFPALNAFHHDGKINYYEHVNIGLAVDADRGLKVPVINQADKKGIGEISQEIENHLLAYLTDELPVEALAGGTFTITDLSGEEVFLFHPLINQGQSAILGVGAEYFPPGSDEGVFNLILSFDHQLTEGRLAAKFLKELRDRLGSYETALRSAGKSTRAEPSCARCMRVASELAELNAPLLQEVRANGDKTLICGICLEGW